MLRPLHPDDYVDDPIMRQTVARLRTSVIAVLAGVGMSVMLAGVVATFAYRDGFTNARTAAATSATGGRTGAKSTAGKRGGARSSGRTGAGTTRAGSGRNGSARGGTTSGKPAVTASRTGRAGTTRGAVEVTGAPATGTWLLLGGGSFLIGMVMFLAARRPYSGARSNAAELVRAYRTLEASTLETFAALNATVEAKDRYTAGHGLRVTLISLLIAQELGMSEVELDVLRHAATFHDIGKIAVPDDVLQKPGRLTDQEFEAMKVHPVESARICSKVAALSEAVPAIRAHHERMDGRGYPDGLAGRHIPLGARIIAVADTWDAITSDRPYRRGQPATVALDEIRRVSGTQFDTSVVEAFLEVLAKDPWMFGLTPDDVGRTPAAPGKRIDTPSRASESTPLVALEGGAQGTDGDGDGDGAEVDWSDGFDREDLAA